MHGALPGSELSRVLMELAARRGLTQPQPPWTFVPEQEGGRQSERGAQYRCALLAPDATLAPLTAEARLILPNGFQHQSVQASAEIRVGFASLKATADTSADLRLSVGEMIEVFMAAWDTATLVIPKALVEDPIAVPLAWPPRAEMYMRACEKRVDGVPQYQELPQFVDFSPLGQATGSQLRDGGITVTAPLGLGKDERRSLVVQAVARMAAGQWGFIEVGDDLSL